MQRAEGYAEFVLGHKIPQGATRDFVDGWYAAKDFGEKFGAYDSPFSAPEHGERPGCEGVALTSELAVEPTPYTSEHNAWMLSLRDFAASWDGGATPMSTIESVYPQRCPDCGAPVIIITTY